MQSIMFIMQGTTALAIAGVTAKGLLELYHWLDERINASIDDYFIEV